MKAKRVLVTGGAGFIPSNFIRHLLADDARTRSSRSTRSPTRATSRTSPTVTSHERLSFVHGDIRDAELVREVVAEVDVIVNAAAESHVEKSIERGRVGVRDHERRGHADPARRDPRARRSSASSSSRPARSTARRERDPMDEEHPLNPRSPYAATKAGADRLAYSYCVTYGLPIVIVRPFNNYGPRQHPEKVDPALHHAGALGRAADDPRRRPREPRLALRRRRRRGDRGDHRGRIDSVAGEVINVATGIDISVTEIADDGARRCSASRASLRTHVRRAPRPGRPPHRLDGEGRAAARLAGADVVRGRARAHRRVVPRQ